MSNNPFNIHLTQWFFNIDPTIVGEYIASFSQIPSIRRWWDGKKWSLPYSGGRSEDEIKRRRATPDASIQSKQLYWCGLSKEAELYQLPLRFRLRP
jgi:hypothetical protein